MDVTEIRRVPVLVVVYKGAQVEWGWKWGI